MRSWQSLTVECWLWAKEAVVFRVVLALIDVGRWLRDHRLVSDLWYRRQATLTVMWLANFVARSPDTSQER